MSGGIRAALVNIGWLSGDRIVRMGGALLVGTLVARYLGPTDFGLFNLATAIFMLFNTSSSLGLDYLVVRDIVLLPDTNHQLLGTAFWLKVAASIVTTLLAVLFTAATHPGSQLILMVTILSVAGISQAYDVIDFYFWGRTLSRRTVIPKLASFLIINLIRIVAVYRHATVLTFIEIAAAEILLGELALLLSYRTFPHGLPSWRFHLPRGRSLLRESWPLVVASLLVMVYMRTDQILIAYFMGERAVGYYSAAVRLSEMWFAIPVLVCNSVMPRLLRTRTADPAAYYRRLQVVYNGLVLLSVTLALLTLPTSGLVIRLMFGAAYQPAAHILNIHVWTAVFAFMGVLGGQQMVHEGLAIMEMRRALAGAVINVLLNLVLIPRYGIAGSACATLIAQATSAYLSDALSKRTWHIFRMKTYALSGLWIMRGGLNFRA